MPLFVFQALDLHCNMWIMNCYNYTKTTRENIRFPKKKHSRFTEPAKHSMRLYGRTSRLQHNLKGRHNTNGKIFGATTILGPVFFFLLYKIYGPILKSPSSTSHCGLICFYCEKQWSVLNYS